MSRTPAQKHALEQLKEGVRKVLAFKPPPKIDPKDSQLLHKAAHSRRTNELTSTDDSATR